MSEKYAGPPTYGLSPEQVDALTRKLAREYASSSDVWIVANNAVALRARVAKLTEALEDQRDRWADLPSGYDDEADENNPSPRDAFAHAAGLAIKAIDKALAAVSE